MSNNLKPHVTSFEHVNKATGLYLPDSVIAVRKSAGAERARKIGEVVRFLNQLFDGFDPSLPENANRVKIGLNGYPMNGGKHCVIRFGTKNDVETFLENASEIEKRFKLILLYGNTEENKNSDDVADAFHKYARDDDGNVTPSIMIVKGAGRRGDAFPSDCSVFLDFTNETIDLVALKQGFCGRGTGYNKNTTTKNILLVFSEKNYKSIKEYILSGCDDLKWGKKFGSHAEKMVDDEKVLKNREHCFAFIDCGPNQQNDRFAGLRHALTRHIARHVVMGLKTTFNRKGVQEKLDGDDYRIIMGKNGIQTYYFPMFDIIKPYMKEINAEIKKSRPFKRMMMPGETNNGKSHTIHDIRFMKVTTGRYNRNDRKQSQRPDESNFEVLFEVNPKTKAVEAYRMSIAVVDDEQHIAEIADKAYIGAGPKSTYRKF